mgnify:FL=1
MSRNLGRTDCRFCGGAVIGDEAPRPATRDDLGAHYEDQYAGMLVAYASCLECAAPYLAWVDERTRTSPLYHEYDRWARGDDAFFDLSHRHRFSSEPAPEDLPFIRIEVIRRRVPAPVCGQCCTPLYHGRCLRRCVEWS